MSTVLISESSPDGQVLKQVVEVLTNPPAQPFVVTVGVVTGIEALRQSSSWRFKTVAEALAKYAAISLLPMQPAPA